MADNLNQDDKGRFTVGNQLWKHRQKTGAKLYDTPQQLMDACYEYFKWVDENPLIVKKSMSGGALVDVPIHRAMTAAGLSIFLGITQRTWTNYKASEELSEVCEVVEEIMFENKFVGAAAGVFNAAIIARDLGLADKKQVESNLTVEVIDSYDDDTDTE